MSRKTRDRRAAGVDPDVLLRRRVALGAQCALALAAGAGAAGPWWQGFLGSLPLTTRSGVVPGAGAEPLAALGLVAAFVVFLVASYDLVADADLQAPTFVAALVLCLAAAGAFHRLWSPERELRGIVEDVARAGAPLDGRSAGEPAAAAPAVAPATPAAVATATPGAVATAAPAPADDPFGRLGVSVRVRWGLALWLASAPLTVVVGGYLTFVAERAGS